MLLCLLVACGSEGVRPIIRNTNAVSRINATYQSAEGERHPVDYPLAPHAQEAILTLLAEGEMQRIGGSRFGMPMIEGVGVEVVLALPSELVTVSIGLERGFVGSNRGTYEIRNPAQLLEKLLDTLELSEESLDTSPE